MRDNPGINATAESMLIFFWLLFSKGATAQQPYIPFKHYSPGQGLSQNHFIAILQDRQGFMWFGTLEGLSKFDGYEFGIFLRDSNDSTFLIQNFASYILEDHEGVIWVGTGEQACAVLIGGKIELQSKVGEGTVFKVISKSRRDSYDRLSD
jgi:ligand-binding sensor domain-containing protein